MTVERLPAEQLFYLATQHPTRIFMRQPVNGQWQEYSYSQIADQVELIASALMEMGLQQGDRIALFSKNCMEWMIADWAIGLAGMISVPLFPSADLDNIAYVMQHCEAKAVFVGKLDKAEHYEGVFAPEVIRIGMPYPTINADKQWTELLANTAKRADMPILTPDDIMTIVYTSGSTGTPKGVILEYQSYINGCASYTAALNSTVTLEHERYLSYLPLAHITERVLGQGLSLYAADSSITMQLSFTESLETFIDNLQDSQPTLFISVPRLWQKFQSGVLAKLPQAKLDVLLNIPLLNRFIKRKIRQGLGLQQVKFCGTGSAPIAPSLLEWYESIGIQISQGWGMTETNAAGTTQAPYRSDKRDSIGKPILNADIRLGDDQEIQIKSHFLMREYYKQPELTAQTFTEDGYFRTGDQGMQDADGYIYIVGRLKDIFKTAKGKYVVPGPIEANLAKCTLLEQICVVGSNLKQPVVLAILDEHARTMAKEKVQMELEALLTVVNSQLDKHERLDGLWILKEPWTVENDMMTPTMKIRRQQIEKHYQSVYEQPMQNKINWQQ